MPNDLNHKTASVFKQHSVSVPPGGSDGSITWTASEFVAHHKGLKWYLILAIITIVLDIGIWFVTKDKITTVVILLVVVLFAFAAARKPRELEYGLDAAGLSVGKRFLAYDDLRSYAVVKEGAFSSLVFIPFKRFSPWVKVYYDPADEPKILALVSSHVPMEDRAQDLTDRIMWRIKF